MIAPAQARSPEEHALPPVVGVEMADRLHVALARLNRALRRSEATELGPGSISALATLRREGPIRPGDLAAREGVTPSTMTRIVALLEGHGYLTKESDPADRRACLVRPTDTGVAFLERLTVSRSRALEARLNRLSPAERAVVAAALPALEALAEGG